jgi:hypothetical protein
VDPIATRSGVAARDPQRIAARVVLIALVTLLIATMAGPAIKAFATGPTIQFINPSKGSSLVISDKPDGTDSKYHLVAAVSSVPSTPAVEFELEDPTGVRTTIPATRVGLTDTWEAFISVPQTFNDGTSDAGYTLRAMLFSGQTEVNRDEEKVIVDNDGSNTNAPLYQAETAEMTYPTNAGPWGVYTAPDGVTTGIIEATLSTATQQGELPTRFIKGLYTVTPPGNEPAWKNCTGTKAVSSGATTVRLRCTIQNQDINTPITAVAVVPNDTPNPSAYSSGFDGAADGHRVVSYKQAATTVNINEPSSTVAASSGVYPCKKLTATVLDQNSRQIAGINVDVHATGPTDNLRFDISGKTPTTSTTGDPSKAPDQGPHGTESAYNCSTSTNGGTQGEHNIISANDRKHIESIAGTNDLGQYSFALKDEDATAGTGETQITVWADSDGDDEYCSGEASANAAIGWGVAAPTPTGEPAETSNCPVPMPEPTVSPTGSPGTNQCNDGLDNDGDRKIDSADRGCKRDNTEAGEVYHHRSSFASFFYSKGAFQGKITSPKTRCIRNRTVVLRRAQKGIDPKVGTDPKTGRHGGFTIAQPKAKGSYYAYVKRSQFFAHGSRHLCLAARSPIVQVGR